MSPKTTAVARAQVGPSVEVFYETGVGLVGPPLLHFTIERTVRAVGENDVEYDRQHDVEQHYHTNTPGVHARDRIFAHFVAYRGPH